MAANDVKSWRNCVVVHAMARLRWSDIALAFLRLFTISFTVRVIALTRRAIFSMVRSSSEVRSSAPCP